MVTSNIILGIGLGALLALLAVLIQEVRSLRALVLHAGDTQRLSREQVTTLRELLEQAGSVEPPNDGAASGPKPRAPTEPLARVEADDGLDEEVTQVASLAPANDRKLGDDEETVKRSTLLPVLKK